MILANHLEIDLKSDYFQSLTRILYSLLLHFICIGVAHAPGGAPRDK